jgi:hypothetical protein
LNYRTPIHFTTKAPAKTHVFRMRHQKRNANTAKPGNCFLMSEENTEKTSVHLAFWWCFLWDACADTASDAGVLQANPPSAAAGEKGFRLAASCFALRRHKSPSRVIATT